MRSARRQHQTVETRARRTAALRGIGDTLRNVLARGTSRSHRVPRIRGVAAMPTFTRPPVRSAMPAIHAYLRTLSFLAWSVVFCAAGASAQSTFGSIAGTVSDSTGAVLPGATITAKNASTQAIRTAVTGTDGTYLITNLDAGSYEVKISLNGFADSVQQASLLARQIARIDLRLQVAGTSERVDVSAQSLFEKSSATINSSRSGED